MYRLTKFVRATISLNRGMALNLKPDNVGVVVFDNNKFIKENRYYSTGPVEDEKKQKFTSVPNSVVIAWYQKLWFREYASRTYDESKFIDFSEEPHGDYVPLSLYKGIMAENSKKDQEIGKLKSQMEIKINDLVFVRCRCQVEVFLDDYGQAADIDKSTLPKSLSHFERTRRIRALNIAWILKNRQDEWRVHNLHRLIEKSEHFKGDVDLFADALSTGYDDLSRIIKRRVLIPGTGDLSYKYAATDEHANRAIETFMDLFEIKDFVTVKKK